MKNQKRLLTLGLFAAVVMAVYFGFQGTRVDARTGARIGTAVGDTAPELVLSTLDGRDIHTRELVNKVVLINAFASWCGPCRIETPELVDVQEAHPGELALIGLNIGEDRAAVEAYRDDFFVNYPLVIDPDGRAAEYYRPRGLPTSWFIDGGGIVRYVHSGPMTVEMIEKVLADIQAGRQPDPF